MSQNLKVIRKNRLQFRLLELQLQLGSQKPSNGSENIKNCREKQDDPFYMIPINKFVDSA